MPRGRKPELNSTEEQIAKIDSEIENYKQKISHAREKRKSLFMKQEKAEMSELYQAVKTSGKSAGEFLDSLNNRSGR